jgi:GT2 family glycosyltransferase
VYPDGRFQHGAFREPGLVQMLFDLFPIARLQDSRLNGRYAANKYRDVPFDVDFVLGACMLVAAEAVSSVGAMDPGFTMYCEEMEWAHRMRTAGWRVVCAPAARVVHHSGASTRRARPDMWVLLWRSRLRYFRMVGPAWRAAALRSVLLASLALLCLTGGPGAPPADSASTRWELARRVLA